jgi:hypothetical protein
LRCDEKCFGAPEKAGESDGHREPRRAFLAQWIIVNGKENPLYENFDRLLAIAKKYDMTISLGDAFVRVA